MPYKSVYVKPRVFLRRGDITIFCTYQDDEENNGENTYHFTQNQYNSNESEFDVRDLSTWKAPAHPPYLCGKDNTPENRKAWDKYHESGVEQKAIRKAIHDAIKSGEIKKEEF